MIKEEQIVKLVTVTITDIFAQNELVTFKLTAVELHDDVIEAKFVVENSTLYSCKSTYRLYLHVGDLQEWIEEDVDEFIKKLEFKLAEALQVKAERKSE